MERAEELKKLMGNPSAFQKEFKPSDMELLDALDRNLLENAIQGGHAEIAAFLTRKGMDPLAHQKGYSFSAFDGVISNQKTGHKIVPAILDAKPSLKEDKKFLAGVLGKATHAGNRKLVELLLKQGAPVSTTWKKRDEREPRSLLHLAVRSDLKPKEKAELVKTLIAAGANVNSTTAPKKRTPIFYTQDPEANGRIPDLLVRAGARLNVRDADGMPLMAWYSLQKEYGMIKYLLRKGIRPPALLLVPRTESRTTSKKVTERVYNPNSRLPSSYRKQQRTVYKTEYFKTNVPICDTVFRNTYKKLCGALAKAGYKAAP